MSTIRKKHEVNAKFSRQEKLKITGIIYLHITNQHTKKA